MKFFKCFILLVLLNFSLMRFKKLGKFFFDNNKDDKPKKPVSNNIEAYITIYRKEKFFSDDSKWGHLLFSNANIDNSIYKKGLVFQENLQKDILLPTKVGNYFLLPFRNLAPIECNARLRNGLYTYVDSLPIKVAVSLWESDCIRLSDEIEKLRKSRIEKIRLSLIDYSGYAASYQIND